MPYIPYPHELTEIMSEFGLPELPEHTDDDDAEARDLILYFRASNKSNMYLRERVTLADAREYTNRDDTNGPGWFVGMELS